ncbi:hypothetical protein [Streptococcus iniae]|nr:hypothetical protein [Streptococcus iniae]
MKFFNWLFTKQEEEQKQVWTIQNNGWEHNAEKYDAMVGEVTNE